MQGGADIYREVGNLDALYLAPSYELYYMNVMVGHQRTWKVCNDISHDWLVWS
jgi:5-deoxy-D-glucuronate isomerase